MATTLTVAYSIGADLFVAHVGDSRCYLLRAGKLRQLTRDHRILQDLVSRGLLTPEQAQRHPLRNALTDAIGGTAPGIRADLGHVALELGDALLLCTDGLTEMISDARIRTVLQSSGDPEAACRRLVDLANDAGGLDNVTAVVARFEPRRPRHRS